MKKERKKSPPLVTYYLVGTNMDGSPVYKCVESAPRGRYRKEEEERRKEKEEKKRIKKEEKKKRKKRIEKKRK